MKIFGKVTAETRVKNWGAPFDGMKGQEANVLYQLATDPRVVQKIPNSI